MGQDRSIAAGHFELKLDSKWTNAYVRNVGGGNLRHHTVDEPIGSHNQRIKHSTVADVEPISFQCGMAGSEDVLRWLQDGIDKDHSTRNGQINHAGADLEIIREHEFFNALMSELTFPALDSGSGGQKDSVYLTVKIQPENTVERNAGGGKLDQSGVLAAQKSWAPNQFRFTLDGVRNIEETVRIEAFTIKQNFKLFHTGEPPRLPRLVPTNVVIPNLVCSISMAFADGVQEWYERYVRKGQNDRRAQRHGSIEFLGPNKKEVLFELSLDQVGLAKSPVVESSGNQHGIKMVKFELFCGSMKVAGAGI